MPVITFNITTRNIMAGHRCVTCAFAISLLRLVSNTHEFYAMKDSKCLRTLTKFWHLMEMATDGQTKKLFSVFGVFFLTFVHSVIWQYMYQGLVITLAVNHVNVNLLPIK